MNMSDYISYWNEVIAEWTVCGEIPASESFWFTEQQHLGLYRNLMPEPYWGDIDCNSVVILNMNPAGADVESPSDPCHRENCNNPDTVCELMSGNYSEVACSFPILKDKDELPEALKQYGGRYWWRKRVEWLNHFEINSSRQPFAIELCAWHSPKWYRGRYSHMRYPRIRKYIEDVFGPALKRALRGSEYKLILCVGSEFARYVFPMIWPEIEEMSLNIEGWPRPKKGNAREFHVYSIPGEGHIITTSARGSNRLPSASKFGDIEKKIIDKIREYKQ